MQLLESLLFLFGGDCGHNQSKSYHLLRINYVLGTEFIHYINYDLIYSPQ